MPLTLISVLLVDLPFGRPCFCKAGTCVELKETPETFVIVDHVMGSRPFSLMRLKCIAEVMSCMSDSAPGCQRSTGYMHFIANPSAESGRHLSEWI